MEWCFELLFYLKKSKVCKAGEAHIYIRITVNGTIAEISKKRKCDPQKWNASAGRLNGKSDSIKAFK